MRDWNFNIHLYWWNRFKVFSSPMRDWNIDIAKFNQYFGVPFLARLWGIETCIFIPSNAWWDGVFSSPMRDWNSVRDSLEINIYFSFLARLWGIETLHLENLLEFSHIVFSSPMRDWNFLIVLVKSSNSFSF